MDRMLYVAMSGAKQAMEQQASVANNMANVSTPGFRAQVNSFRAVPVVAATSRPPAPSWSPPRRAPTSATAR